MKYINQVKRIPDKEDLAYMEEQEKNRKKEAGSYDVDKSLSSLIDVDDAKDNKKPRKRKNKNINTIEENENPLD
jgi:hypothetical protein